MWQNDWKYDGCRSYFRRFTSSEFNVHFRIDLENGGYLVQCMIDFRALEPTRVFKQEVGTLADAFILADRIVAGDFSNTKLHV